MLEPGVAFLNHGSFGAVPRVIFDAQAEWRRRIEASPVELLGRQCPALLAKAKSAIGRFLGMEPADFGLVTNASEGANAVLRSIDLRPGEELVTTTHVYGAVRQAMRYAAGRAGAGYREIDVPLPARSADAMTDAVLAGLGGRTRLLVIDHVTSPTALVFPVRQIAAACAARGVEVLFDGAHAPGMLEFAVPALGATYYAGNLHKWCCAPKGCGFLWVRPDRQTDVHPTVISHHLGEGFAREFDWQGTRDITAWLTGPAALAFMAELGWPDVRAHNHSMAVWAHRMLCDRWKVDPVSPLDGALLGSMATVPLPGALRDMTEPEGLALQQRMYSEHRIEVPIIRWCGRWFLRVSCQAYNKPDQYLLLADAVATLARDA
jgi:isopenicillin-N epimerase